MRSSESFRVDNHRRSWPGNLGVRSGQTVDSVVPARRRSRGAPRRRLLIYSSRLACGGPSVRRRPRPADSATIRFARSIATSGAMQTKHPTGTRDRHDRPDHPSVLDATLAAYAGLDDSPDRGSGQRSDACRGASSALGIRAGAARRGCLSAGLSGPGAADRQPRRPRSGDRHCHPRSGFITYVTWRCYLTTGEPFLRWLTLSFLAFRCSTRRTVFHAAGTRARMDVSHLRTGVTWQWPSFFSRASSSTACRRMPQCRRRSLLSGAAGRRIR